MNVSSFSRCLPVAVLSLLFHLLLGWEWTLLAAVAGGLWTGRGGWIVGGGGVFLDYLALVLYSFAVDARAASEMAELIGALLGNMPALAVVAITLLIGAAIGTIGGAAGTQLGRLIHVPGRQSGAA